MNAKLPAPRTGGSVERSGESDDRNFQGEPLTDTVDSCFVQTRSVRRETVEETRVVIERRVRKGDSCRR